MVYTYDLRLRLADQGGFLRTIVGAVSDAAGAEVVPYRGVLDHTGPTMTQRDVYLDAAGIDPSAVPWLSR